ncbi:hypothetical protein L284_12835 [Novosphingobium lindaniclasticum LE124]|uniref:Uncharacterized protein n=1 Tax=Novosphingobium lindaniclasticum LE124 TaxID=1096930 RepID=T0HNF5_9SPHN|nr:hypothetical protein L284_12835 [Novosphingobium lindaniclasticum LE124]
MLKMQIFSHLLLSKTVCQIRNLILNLDRIL